MELMPLRRHLSATESERLLAALRRDKLGTGWLRPWLWRRGWLIRPPIFQAFSPDVAADRLLVIAMIFIFGFGAAYALYVTCQLLQCIWRFLLGLVKVKDLRKILLRVAIAALLAGAIYVMNPWTLPSMEALSARFHNYTAMGLLFFLMQMFVHWNSHAERKLPAWRDYVDLALAPEKF